MAMECMEHDHRPIVWLSGPAPREMYYEVGKGGVERITIGTVNGQMAAVPWFAVWKNGVVIRRCNAALVEEGSYKEN